MHSDQNAIDNIKNKPTTVKDIIFKGKKHAYDVKKTFDKIFLTAGIQKQWKKKKIIDRREQ